MTTLLDIVFSTILGGVILLITLSANMTLRQTWTSYNNQAMVQNMLIQTAEIIECDLRNMGCGVAANNQTINDAEDTCITFLMANGPKITDLPQPVTYRTGNLEPGTDNPNDRWLLRTMGGNTDNIGLVTQFRLRYLNQFGQVMATPVDVDKLQNIKTVEITMEVQSPFIVIYDPNERYASALWKQTRLASQNLSR